MPSTQLAVMFQPGKFLKSTPPSQNKFGKQRVTFSKSAVTPALTSLPTATQSTAARSAGVRATLARKLALRECASSTSSSDDTSRDIHVSGIVKDAGPASLAASAK